MSIVVRALETAERADPGFVVHATWAHERPAGMVAHVRFGEITEYNPCAFP